VLDAAEAVEPVREWDVGGGGAGLGDGTGPGTGDG